MTLAPLAWSAPATRFFASITAEDGAADWRIVPVPRDVSRIHYNGVDADGTIVTSMEENGYAETVEEAKIVIDVIRAGTDHLSGWRAQLEAAGFVRAYPDAAPGDNLSVIWRDERKSGLFSINVFDGSLEGARADEICVHATYESEGATSWHNVSKIRHFEPNLRTRGPVTMRQGLPTGVDVLKAGIAAALAIRAARIARGGRFSTPLGGATPSLPK